MVAKLPLRTAWLRNGLAENQKSLAFPRAAAGAGGRRSAFQAGMISPKPAARAVAAANEKARAARAVQQAKAQAP